MVWGHLGLFAEDGLFENDHAREVCSRRTKGGHDASVGFEDAIRRLVFGSSLRFLGTWGSEIIFVLDRLDLSDNGMSRGLTVEKHPLTVGPVGTTHMRNA